MAPVAVEARLGLAERARRSEPSIRELLGSADEGVRARAALAAGRIRSADALPELAANLAGEEAGSAAWALGRIKGGEPVLVRCVLERCPGAAEAARALGGPGRGPEVIPALAAALDGPAQLAAEAALALGIIARVGGKGAENKVRDAAGRDRKSVV